MYSTFNMGVGMVLAVAKTDYEAVMAFFTEKNEAAVKLGKVVKSKKGVIIDF